MKGLPSKTKMREKADETYQKPRKTYQKRPVSYHKGQCCVVDGKTFCEENDCSECYIALQMR